VDIFKHITKKNKKIKRADQVLPEVYGTTLSVLNVSSVIELKQEIESSYMTLLRHI
jgi:hypothetical protein